MHCKRTSMTNITGLLVIKRDTASLSICAYWRLPFKTYQLLNNRHLYVLYMYAAPLLVPTVLLIRSIVLFLHQNTCSFTVRLQGKWADAPVPIHIHDDRSIVSHSLLTKQTAPFWNFQRIQLISGYIHGFQCWQHPWQLRRQSSQHVATEVDGSNVGGIRLDPHRGENRQGLRLPVT